MFKKKGVKEKKKKTIVLQRKITKITLQNNWKIFSAYKPLKKLETKILQISIRISIYYEIKAIELCTYFIL